MASFIWDQTLALKVDSMDEEHKSLIGLMNSLEEKWIAKSSFEELNDCMKRLITFTIKHFSDEEAYMKSVGFPEFPQHKALHSQMLSQLGAFATQFEASKILDDKFFHFLQMWLKGHIRGVDKKYSIHRNDKSNPNR